jgi:hypothetical protein
MARRRSAGVPPRLVAAALACVAARALPTAFFVSPAGSDATGDGSAAAPWASWARAVAGVRPALAPAQAADVTVTFAPGRYALAAPVVLTAADSGANGFDVVYAGATGAAADVLFDGGVLLDDDAWAPVAGAPGVFSAALPFPTREVYAFGARVAEAPARGVNLTAANTQGTATGYVTSDALLVAAAAAPGGLARAADVELLFTSAAAQWQESRARVAAWALVNASALRLDMAQPGWALVRGKPYAEALPTAVLNVLGAGALDAGQGVLSPARGAVFYRPASGTMAGAGAWAAALDGELLLLDGAPAARVARVRVENVSFRGATWLAPTTEGAYAPDQGGIVYRASDLPGPLGAHALHPVPAAVTLRGAGNVTLRGVAVAHTGGTAIAVEGGSQDVRLSRVSVRDAGCSGVRLGEVADADASDAGALNARLTLADSTLTALAQGYRDCSALFGGFITESSIEHNNITDANWAGVTLGWLGWGGAPIRPSLGGNRIVGNAISRVNLVTGDGGPIYVMAPQPSRADCGADDLGCRSEIAGNFVSYAIHHAAMLYHDEGSGFFYTHDNVVLQPQLNDPHGWWWSWAAAWASTEHNILVTRNVAVGVNRSDFYAGNNLVCVNNTLLPWGSAWPPAALDIIAQAGPRG